MQLKVSGTGRRVVAAAGVLAVATAGAVIARADEQSARHGAVAPAASRSARPRSSVRRRPGVANAVKVTNNSREALTVTRQRAAVDAVVVRPRQPEPPPHAVRRHGQRGARSRSRRAPSKDVTVTLSGAPAGGSLYGALEVVGLPRNASTRKGVVTGYRIVGALRYNPATPHVRPHGRRGQGRPRASIVLPVRSTGNTAEPVSGTVRVQRPARHAPGLDQGDADPAGQARVAAAASRPRA